MLVKVLRGDSIATRRRLARKGNITFEDLMRATSDFDVRTVTIEGLTSVRYLLPVTVGIITVMATMRSAGLSWSHHTCRIDGDIGSLSNESISEPLPSGGGGCRTAFLYQRKALGAGTLDGAVFILNRFLVQCPTKRVSSAPGQVVTVTRLGRAAPLPLEHPSRDHLQGGRLPIPLRRVGRHAHRTRTHRALSSDASPARGPARASEITRVVLCRGSACRDPAWRGGACISGARPRTMFFDRCCRSASTTAGCGLSGGT